MHFSLEIETYRDYQRSEAKNRLLGQVPDLGFSGPLFALAHAPAAAGLVKKAHDGQDPASGDDRPFCPGERPLDNGQNDDSC